MSDAYQALQIPPTALEKGGVEVLRAAIIDGNVHVTLRPAFKDPQAWGMLLADVLRNVARAYAHQNMYSEEDVLAKAREAFSQDLDTTPTTTTTVSQIS